MKNFLSVPLFEEKDLIKKDYKKGREVDDNLGLDDFVVFIMEGKLGVHSASNKDVLLSILNKGDVFGLSNLYSEKELNSRLYVIEDCSLCFVSKEKVRALFARNEKLRNEYNVYLNDKMNFLLRRIALLTLPNAKERVEAYYKGDNLDLNLTSKDEISSYLGISRTQLFRAVKALKLIKE